MKNSEEVTLDNLFPVNKYDDFFMWNFKKGLEKREIYINDEVNEDFFATVIRPFIQMEKESKDPIHIYINSPGGNIMDGMVFCNLIDNVTCPVLIETVGFAYSMAGYIAMAGANNPNVKRVCHKYSFGLIHAGNVGYSGDARKAKQVQAFYDRIDALVKDYILTHTKITEEQYTKNIDVEWYMTSDEMLELGIVDEII